MRMLLARFIGFLALMRAAWAERHAHRRAREPRLRPCAHPSWPWAIYWDTNCNKILKPKQRLISDISLE